ncbi:MAG TPA: O-antigen ligase family protein [Chloroflexota bacterium]|nr:O-antigen ligase family protein [Chloroflexota bacterium]
MNAMISQGAIRSRSLEPVVVCLGVLTAAAIFATGQVPFSPIVLSLAAIAFVVMLARPELGVALVPVVATVVPQAIGTGTESRIPAALLVGALLPGVWIARALLARHFVVVKSPINAPVFTLMVVWLMAYLFSNASRPPLVVPWDSFWKAQLGGLGVFLVSAALLLLALNTGREIRYIRIATWSLIGVGIVGIAAYYLHQTGLIWFMAINGLYAMWVVALAYGQALYNRDLPSWARLGLLVLVAGLLYKGLIREVVWFSGWIPLLVVIAVITFFHSRRAVVILAAVLAAAIPLKYSQFSSTVWGLAVGKGDLSRLDIWQQQAQLIQQYPILGTGPAGYAVYNMSLFANSPFAMSTHSNYLDVIDQTGVIGSLVFIWFLIVLFILGWRASRRWRSGFLGGYANGAFGGLCGVVVAMALGDWFIPFVYNQTIYGFRWTVHSWIYLGFLASLAALRSTSEVA